MIRQRSRKGFTLIELMIVVTIMAMLTPVIFRLYHVGLRTGSDQVEWNTGNLADAAVIMEYLEGDFSRAVASLNDFNGMKAGDQTLILKMLSKAEQKSLLSGKGDLSGREMPTRFETVVYSLSENGEAVRSLYPSAAEDNEAAVSKKILLKGSDVFRFDFNGLAPGSANLVRVVIRSKPVNPYIRAMPALARVFKIG